MIKNFFLYFVLVFFSFQLSFGQSPIDFEDLPSINITKDQKLFTKKNGHLGTEKVVTEKKFINTKTTLPIGTIRFMQNTCSNNHSENCYTVIDNAKKIRRGELDINVFPPIRVWKDQNGKIWTLDHRRLAAMILSGTIEDVPVQWVGEQQVKKQGRKFSTATDGEVMFIILDKDNALEIRRPKPSSTCLQEILLRQSY